MLTQAECNNVGNQSMHPCLLQVRRVPVQTARMALSDLSVRAPKTEEVRSVEASLRLDAVASAGFRMSRAKAADLVKAGDIRWASANWDQQAFLEPMHADRCDCIDVCHAWGPVLCEQG